MKRTDLWQPGEYSYPLAFGFMPNFRQYIIEDGKTHPCMLILPGGAYANVSPSEGEVVAKAFLKLGYNCFVMSYTTNRLTRVPLMEQPLKDLARAVRILRKHADEYNIDPNRLYICGFSAAGHLCATLCDYFNEVPDDNPEYASVSCRPDAAVLCYPVITTDGPVHRGSIMNLLGADIYDRDDAQGRALMDRFSLEKHVRDDTPPCFIWQTVTDGSVPIENSYLYADALKKKGIRHALHAFSCGGHGISTADENWAKGRFGETYTWEQAYALQKAIIEGKIEVSEELKVQLMKETDRSNWSQSENPEAAIWPVLADGFLKGLN